MLSNSAVDVVIVRGEFTYKDAAIKKAMLPLSLAIQATVEVGPIQKDKSDTTVPRFAAEETTAMTVIESTSAQTKMLAPYVIYEGEFNTGIAVSNTTDDQAGTVHFALYMEGVETKYSTSMLDPQTTMRMLLHELLTLAGHTGSFVGYMTITTDFTGGAGSVFISDFSGFTSAVMLQDP